MTQIFIEFADKIEELSGVYNPRALKIDLNVFVAERGYQIVKVPFVPGADDGDTIVRGEN